MSDSLRIVLALILVNVALFGEKIVNNIEIVNEPTVQVVEPSLENKELVKPIVDIDIESKDANLLSAFYVEMADVVAKDDSVIETTGQFRNFNMMAGPLHFDTSLKGKYDSLGSNIDEAIANAIGKESVTMDDDKREDLVEILEAIAWSVNK